MLQIHHHQIKIKSAPKKFARYLLGSFSCLIIFCSCDDSSKRPHAENPPTNIYIPKTVDSRPLPSRPVTGLNPAQIDFWNYLEQFNRLPENPSKEAIAVFDTKGIAPHFHYLVTSKTSIFGNIQGLNAHREIFLTRYPWVHPLLTHYLISIPISSERFSGSAKEIGQKYEKLMWISARCAENAENEKRLVANFLEGLLVVDYLYACGTVKDKQEAIDVLNGVFEMTWLIHPFKKTLGDKLFMPASMEIGWPVIADFPELIEGMTTLRIREGFSINAHAEKVNFSKWLLRTKGILEMKNKNDQNRERGLIQNEQVLVDLIGYSIYTAHCTEKIRPQDSPDLIVIQILFKRLYPKDHVNQYQHYLTLLNSAYPKTKS